MRALLAIALVLALPSIADADRKKKGRAKKKPVPVKTVEPWEQIEEPEDVAKKHVLVNRKAELKGKLETIEANRSNRFEPVIRFVLDAKQGEFCSPKEIGRKIAISLKTSVRTSNWPKNSWPWISTPLAINGRIQFRPNYFPRASAGKWGICKLAEREGFEPPVGLRLHVLSKHAHSTTLPPLRDCERVELREFPRSRSTANPVRKISPENGRKRLA